jgi:peptidoglycan/xylan/chitin deacetylase (PgdA/CDA1 family)
MRGTPAQVTRALWCSVALALLFTATGCTTPRRPGAARPAPRHSAAPVPTPRAPAVDPLLLRVPTFPPGPDPQPVPLPTGGDQAPLFSRLPTTQPVAFLTVDDGWVQAPEQVALMRAANVPFTMFLIAPVAAQAAGFFRQLVAAGGVVGDHTVDHPHLRGRSSAFQRHQVCDSATTLGQVFGQRPRLFRPPYGEYDATTLRVAHECGYTAVLNWSETVTDGTVAYQTADRHIHPGDIVLLHFQPDFVADVLAALSVMRADGLTPAVLADYLPAGRPAL